MISASSLRFRRACPDKARTLRESDPSLSPIVAEMLVARGYSTPEQVKRFFNPTPEALHDPFRLKGMEEAARLLKTALSEGKRVLIHGDYDCDGICATTLLMEALQEIGAEVDYHIPDRFDEGYGLSEQAVDRCSNEGFGLLVTVDCGSSSHKEIEKAKAAGVQVIVTDHHAVPPDAPTPDAFVNPQQRGCDYPFKGICGTGVAYKLVQALRGQSGADPAHLLDLVAIATVADVVPLVDENRVLVQLGLQEAARSRREGLRALLEVAGLTGTDAVDAFTVGFTLGPRLNAAGRLEHARAGVELLMSRSVSESRKLATHLDALNEARKEREKSIQREIEERLHSDPGRWKRGAIVEWGEDWHEGVIGITAGRLAEKYGVPTLVIAVRDGWAKGSGRSPENVDLYQALKSCGHLFTKFGGHPRAGGFSLAADNLPRLAEAMVEVARALRTGPAPVWVDGCLTLAQADLGLVRELERMEPFGEANPKPTFLLEGLDIVNRRLVGKSGDHLQLEVEQVGLRRRAIAFRQADLVDELLPQEYRYDLRCELGRDSYKGREQLKVQVVGIVQPPCSELRETSVMDLRHVRTRKKSLLHCLDADPGLVALCHDPGRAKSLYPDLSERFHAYDACPRGISGLLLLSPPRSVTQFEDCMKQAVPRRLVILFGLQELERYLHRARALSWGRDAAVRLWQRLRADTATLDTKKVVALASEQLKLAAEITEEILEAFQETRVLAAEGAVLVFSQGNGIRLEETRAFRRQFERVKALEELRAFFSGPELASRLTARWPWLSEAEAIQDSARKEQTLLYGC